MEYLYNYIDEFSIKEMIEINDNIKELSKESIKEKIDLLKSINCSDKQIRNIIITNPLFLLEDIENIIELINKLSYIGIDSFNYLFDNDSDLLTRGIYYIDDFINKKISNGYTLVDIKELINNDSSIIYN